METTTTTIYEEVKKANLKTDHHCSDLYIPVNDVSKAIIDNYKNKSNVTTFTDNIDGELWYDIPFAYDPFFGVVTK